MTDYLYRMTFGPTINAMRYSTTANTQSLNSGASMTCNGLTTVPTGGRIAQMTTQAPQLDFTMTNNSTITPSYSVRIQPTWNADLTGESHPAVTDKVGLIKYVDRSDPKLFDKNV